MKVENINLFLEKTHKTKDEENKRKWKWNKSIITKGGRKAQTKRLDNLVRINSDKKMAANQTIQQKQDQSGKHAKEDTEKIAEDQIHRHSTVDFFISLNFSKMLNFDTLWIVESKACIVPIRHINITDYNSKLDKFKKILQLGWWFLIFSKWKNVRSLFIQAGCGENQFEQRNPTKVMKSIS